MTRRPVKLSAPFLRRLSVTDTPTKEVYPFDLPIVRSGALEIYFNKPTTIFVGENGAGKSTLLEAIAAVAGFNPEGGSASHRFGDSSRQRLSDILKAAWLPKIRKGFFFRAESFFSFSNYIDYLAKDDPSIWKSYGGRSLHTHSHGESFITLFESHFERSTDRLFILDEPEAALSPTSQFRFLRTLAKLEKNNNQIIMASHSPILMAYPEADLRLISEGRIRPIDVRETSQFLLWREFVKRPEDLVKEILSETRTDSDASKSDPSNYK